MFTLKLRWEERARYPGTAPVDVLERADTFVACHTVTVGLEVTEDTWRDVSNRYYETEGTIVDMKLSAGYKLDDDGNELSHHLCAGKLIKADTPTGRYRCIVSHAWLLGPDGQTIERLV